MAKRRKTKTLARAALSARKKRKRARKARLVHPKLKQESFSAEVPRTEFIEQRIAPPEEEITSPAGQRRLQSLAHAPESEHEQRAEPHQAAPSYHHGKMVRRSTFLKLFFSFVISAVASGILAAVFFLFLNMSMLHTILISASLFIVFFIVSYALFE